MDAVATRRQTIIFFVVLMACFTVAVSRCWAAISFPQVDAGQMRLHVRAPPGTRIEETQEDFAKVEAAIRQIVGNEQIDVILDNIGLPYSGINIALERFRHHRADGWRNSHFAAKETYADCGAYGKIAPRIARSALPECNFSSSPPISSIRC